MQEFLRGPRGDGIEQRDQDAVDGLLTGPAKSKAGQRHSDLRHRQQAPGVGKQIESGLRTGMSVFRHVTEPRVPDRKQGHFGAREKAVDGD